MSNDTGHWNVFFAKSVDGGKTFSKSIILNVINTGNTINANTHISASGNNVYITWWTNQKASSDLVFSPSFRASNDNGSTFGNIVMLNKNGSTTVAPGAGAPIVTSNVPPTIVGSPTASVGNNVYMAWPSNSTGHWNIFFAKSVDGGKTFKAFILSSPNTGKVVDFGTNIVASGNDVYVNWWTNKSGRFEPVFRASNDNGTTFGNIIRLNSTSGGVSK